MSEPSPLDGVKVLDLTRALSGPFCTMILGDLGADVIKVEKSGEGDATRGQLRDIPDADSLYFTMLNCNKRSITVNMKSAEGKAVFVDLIKQCDIVMENFGPGVLDRLGFTWEKIHQINPRIVMGSIKGFGSTGPYAEFKAYEDATITTPSSGQRMRDCADQIGQQVASFIARAQSGK